MVKSVILTIWKCKRCGHEWLPRIPDKPVLCPRCKRNEWERPVKTYWSRKPIKKTASKTKQTPEVQTRTITQTA